MAPPNIPCRGWGVPGVKVPSYYCLPHLSGRSVLPGRNLAMEMWLFVLWEPMGPPWEFQSGLRLGTVGICVA